MNKNNTSILYDKLTLELRRGVLILAALSQLQEEQYGYTLAQRLAEQGLAIEQGTLYPLLRRLEEQGMLESEWMMESGSRPRRYYLLSPAGREMLRRLTQDWRAIIAVMDGLLANVKEM